MQKPLLRALKLILPGVFDKDDLKGMQIKSPCSNFCNVLHLYGKTYGNAFVINAVAAYSLQSCPTLCHPMDSLPTRKFHGIFYARILECIAIPFSGESSRPRDRTQVSFIGRWTLLLSHLGSPYIYELLVSLKLAMVSGTQYGLNT